MNKIKLIRNNKYNSDTVEAYDVYYKENSLGGLLFEPNTQLAQLVGMNLNIPKIRIENVATLEQARERITSLLYNQIKQLTVSA